MPAFHPGKVAGTEAFGWL